MSIIETPLKGCFVIEPKIFKDERGIFFESYKKNDLEDALGYGVNFVQTNHSVSKQGVLRGLHFQKGEYAQAKLVRVIQGEVLDVIVDLRQGSETYKKHFKFKLSQDNLKSIFIPKGMAHGFLTLSDEAVFSYQCDNYYNKAAEGGIIYNDKDLNIDWVYGKDKLILSKKDSVLPTFKESFI